MPEEVSAVLRLEVPCMDYRIALHHSSSLRSSLFNKPSSGSSSSPDVRAAFNEKAKAMAEPVPVRRTMHGLDFKSRKGVLRFI